MRRAEVPAALVLAASAVLAGDLSQRQAPIYSALSIVNLATGQPGDLAPNSLAAIYGENLSSATRARSEVSAGGVIPYVLPGTGVTVKVSGLLAGIEFASPEVVVFIVPPDLLAGPAKIVLTRNSLNGPAVRVELQPVAPALLPSGEGWLLARDAATMEWITEERPAVAGQEIVVYATGLGATAVRLANLSPAPERSEITRKDGLVVYLDHMAVDRRDIGYAGVTPGAAGIYEIHLRIPLWAGPQPEMHIALGEKRSQPGLRLHVVRGDVQPEDQTARSTQ